MSYQSQSRDSHLAAIGSLVSAGHTYPCSCSRAELAGCPAGPLGVIYPGTCRSGTKPGETAIRVRTSDEPLHIDDGIQGPGTYRLESESGDFIVLRRDGLVAYQLAVVVDDFLQGITEVTRGADLLPSTPRQVWLQHLLGYPRPQYMHIPIAVDSSGEKLSKSTGAEPLSTADVCTSLVRALAALNQFPPGGLATEALPAVWDWAIRNWQPWTLRGIRQIDPVLHAPH